MPYLLSNAFKSLLTVAFNELNEIKTKLYMYFPNINSIVFHKSIYVGGLVLCKK